KLLRQGAARLISIWHEETTISKNVYVVIREKDDGHHFLIRNSTPCDVTVTIKLADIENGRSDAASPWTKTLHPKSTLTAFRLTSNNSLEPLKYKYTWDWRYGTPDAIHDDSNNYLLPFDQRVLQESLN